MSPQAKHDTKWLVGMVSITIGTLLTVIGATAKITTKFNKVDSQFESVTTEFSQNDEDHTAIIQSLKTEVTRATAADKKLSEKVDDIGGKQIQVMTNQRTILKAIENNSP